MKREFLTELKLDEAVVEQIMKEYGKSINASLTEIGELKTEVTTLKSQIAERDKDLKKLEKTANLNDDQATKLKELQTRYESEKADLEKQLLDNSKNSAVEIAIAKSGVIDGVALKAHIAEFVAKAEFKDNEVVGLTSHINELIADKLAYLKPDTKKATGGEFNKTGGLDPEKDLAKKSAQAMGLKE